MKMAVNTVLVEQDVAYLEAGRSERLDLYRPTTAAGPRPVVIFIHGGAFHTGRKSSERPRLFSELMAGAGPTNLLSVMNLRDEFVFAGNHTAPYERRIAQGECCLMPEDATGDRAHSNEWTITLDVDGTLMRGEKGFRFDPLGTHFGHSLKHYTNGLRSLGISHILRRALAREGAFRLGEIVAEAMRSGELNLPRNAGAAPCISR